jgi:hypothetical protein
MSGRGRGSMCTGLPKACLSFDQSDVSIHFLSAPELQHHLATSDEETRTFLPKTLLAASPSNAALCHCEYERLLTAKSISTRFFSDRIESTLSGYIDPSMTINTLWKLCIPSSFDPCVLDTYIRIRSCPTTRSIPTRMSWKLLCIPNIALLRS